MAETQRERETKFDVPADFAVPDLDEPADVERSTVQLTSTYFDTSDFALLTHRVTLRRRTGDADTGWHLKVPSGDARTEIRLPLEAGGDELSADSIPAKLTELTVGLAHGAVLAPVAEIATRRERHQLMDGTEVLAEIADDHVRATAFGPAVRVMEWREVEIELGTGDEQLLARLGHQLEAAGAVAATTPSKLARVLDRGEPAVDEAVRPLHEYLVEQLRVLGAGDVALRRGLDPIHKTRVAARRFRSVLRVFADVLDEARASALDQELSWYQDLLGEVRDRQVQRARFAAAIDSLPPEMVLGPVAGDIDSALLSDQLAAAERLTAALSGERYLTLMGEALAWTTALPARPGTTPSDVASAARSARKKAAKRLRQAVRAGRPELLHRARKAIKRARYATELVEGTSAKRVKRYKRLQDVLGEHQDCVIAAELLHRLGAATVTEPGRNGFTYGVLWQREQVLAAKARKKAAKLKA